ncbi:hypothetical protein B0H12DRAFT_1225492 [Mycena haematopus]|nr:hypothetical protein B0H12DRAFT_1225492 [Mycena haematopus]
MPPIKFRIYCAQILALGMKHQSGDPPSGTILYWARQTVKTALVVGKGNRPVISILRSTVERRKLEYRQLQRSIEIHDHQALRIPPFASATLERRWAVEVHRLLQAVFYPRLATIRPSEKVDSSQPLSNARSSRQGKRTTFTHTYTTSPDPGSGMQTLQQTCSAIIEHVLRPSDIILSGGGYTLRAALAEVLQDAIPVLGRLLDLALRNVKLPSAQSFCHSELRILTYTTGLDMASQPQIVWNWVHLLNNVHVAMKDLHSLWQGRPVYIIGCERPSRMSQILSRLPTSLRTKLPSDFLWEYGIPSVSLVASASVGTWQAAAREREGSLARSSSPARSTSHPLESIEAGGLSAPFEHPSGIPVIHATRIGQDATSRTEAHSPILPSSSTESPFAPSTCSLSTAADVPMNALDLQYGDKSNASSLCMRTYDLIMKKSLEEYNIADRGTDIPWTTPRFALQHDLAVYVQDITEQMQSLLTRAAYRLRGETTFFAIDPCQELMASLQGSSAVDMLHISWNSLIQRMGIARKAFDEYQSAFSEARLPTATYLEHGLAHTRSLNGGMESSVITPARRVESVKSSSFIHSLTVEISGKKTFENNIRTEPALCAPSAKPLAAPRVSDIVKISSESGEHHPLHRAAHSPSLSSPLPAPALSFESLVELGGQSDSFSAKDQQNMEASSSARAHTSGKLSAPPPPRNLFLQSAAGLQISSPSVLECPGQQRADEVVKGHGMSSPKTLQQHGNHWRKDSRAAQPTGRRVVELVKQSDEINASVERGLAIDVSRASSAAEHEGLDGTLRQRDEFSADTKNNTLLTSQGFPNVSEITALQSPASAPAYPPGIVLFGNPQWMAWRAAEARRERLWVSALVSARHLLEIRSGSIGVSSSASSGKENGGRGRSSSATATTDHLIIPPIHDS